MQFQRGERKLTADGTNAAETLRMSVFNDPTSFGKQSSLEYNFTIFLPNQLPPISDICALLRATTGERYLMKRRCPGGEVKIMYYISKIWKILLLISRSAKYLKDGFYLSNTAANRGLVLQRNPNFFHIQRLS